MLQDHASSAIVAARDYERARQFYQDVLGLDLIDGFAGQVMTFRTGDTRLFVYVSDFAGTNRANAAVWSVGDDLEAIVAALKARGVAFEHYQDVGHTRMDGDIHIAGDMKLVWFKDPDGNILHLNNM